MGELYETEQRLYWVEVLMKGLFNKLAPGALENSYQWMVDNNADKEQLELFKEIYLED